VRDKPSFAGAILEIGYGREMAAKVIDMLPALALALLLAQATPDAAAAQPPAAVAPTVAPDDGDVPKGAPSDDYGLVAWCRGALRGHMDLFTIVKPELISLQRSGEAAQNEKSDLEQMQAGREYIALYRRAMAKAEAAHPELHARGLAVDAEGEAIWDAAKQAEPRTRMWSWLMWDLPGRCETAAHRLLGTNHDGGAPPPALLRGPQ